MLRKVNDKFQENLSRSGIIDARARRLRNSGLKGPVQACNGITLFYHTMTVPKNAQL